MIVRTIITLALLSAASGATAKDILDGDVFECEPVQSMRVEPSQERYQRAPLQKFTLLIDEPSVKFLSPDGGYVNGVKLMKKYHQPHLLSAYSDNSAFSLERKESRSKFRFHYVNAMFSRSFVMFGYCRAY